MGFFTKFEKKIYKEGRNNILIMKFSRFGQKFYFSSKSQKFLSSFSELAKHYANSKNLYNIDMIKDKEYEPGYSNYVEWHEKIENRIHVLWNNLLEDTDSRTKSLEYYYAYNHGYKHYYGYWIGDVEFAIFYLNDFMVRESILKDSIMFYHLKQIIEKRNSLKNPFPKKHKTVLYQHLEFLINKNKLYFDLDMSINNDNLISQIVEILNHKTIDEIYGDLESYSDDIVEDYDKPYNITYIVIHQIEILGKRFECVNLMYLLIARDYVYRFHSNNEDKLNFPELSTLELSNIVSPINPMESHFSQP